MQASQIRLAQAVMNAEQPLIRGECSALEPELGKYWEFEQDSTQVSDLQGCLMPCCPLRTSVSGPSPSL